MQRLDPSPQDTSQEAEKSLVDAVHEYVEHLLAQWHPQKITERKVIHDPILGSNVFEPYEIALIDSPFCQRLRRISQTDVASLVYPSANHNRLEHSLGVATIASRVLESLSESFKRSSANPVTEQAWCEVRIAAILHDIGHGVFSHLSEEIYQNFPEIDLYHSSNLGKFSRDKPHEMIGYLIINDNSFKDFLKNEIIKEYGLPGEIRIEKIAEFITPVGGKDDITGWQADIINGPFDADKFDYLQRDAYFSGLKLGIDLDRFLHCVWMESKAGSPRQLKIMTTGATTLEQILFSKLILNSSIYHHQKIRAAECAVKGIFEIVRAHDDNPEYQINNRKMNHTLDFLYVTEQDVLSLENKSTELQTHIQQFLNRELFKRALVISVDTVENPHLSPGYQKFKSLVEQPNDLYKLRCELAEALDMKYPVHQVWIDLPQTLTFEDALFARIQDKGGQTKFMADTFPVAEWLTAYGSNKWKGYVFCPLGSNEDRERVGRKAAELISSKYEFSIDITEAIDQAKIR